MSDLASDSSRTQAVGPEDLMESGVKTRLSHTRGGATQAEQAARLGVHLNTYSRWERGERAPDAYALMVLATQGWNLNWLLTGEGPERLDHALARTAPASSPSGDIDLDTLTLALGLTQAQEADDGPYSLNAFSRELAANYRLLANKVGGVSIGSAIYHAIRDGDAAPSNSDLEPDKD